MKVLVTGAAGFIGFHTARHLICRGDTVVGIDNLNDYYDVSLKEARLNALSNHEKGAAFSFRNINIADRDSLNVIFAEEGIERVVNLAAQAGVRYAAINPHAYIESNIVGFTNILECCRHHSVKHLVYASSSSVYGANESLPFPIHDNVDHPISLYAATKKANELMAHSYSHLYNIPTTGLRFFTVYGPWGRPDMALFLFTKAILEGSSIDVFNYGKHKRDFTYIDDIVTGVVRTLDKIAEPNQQWSGLHPDPGTSRAPWRVYNIGNNEPVDLMDYIETLESKLGRTVKKNMKPLQPGDVPDTYADVTALIEDIGYKPSTPISIGIENFVDWYLKYYNIG
jgi:UDP-glucuronate 4-epimerase